MGPGLPYGLGVAPRSWTETVRAQAGDPGCTGETRVVYVDDVLWVRRAAVNEGASAGGRNAEEGPGASEDDTGATRIPSRQ